MLHTNYSTSKAVTVPVIGALQIVLGLTLGNAYGAYYFINQNFFQFGLFPFGSPAVWGYPLLVLLKLWLIVRGIKNLRMVSRYRKVHRAMGRETRQKLEVLATALGCSVEKAANHIRQLLARGFWKQGYFDLEAKEFVLGRPEEVSENDETFLREIKVKSTLPVIGFAAVWIAYVVFLDERGVGIAQAAIASLTVLIVLKILSPAKTKVVEDRIPAPKPVQPAKVESGDKAVDEVLEAANTNIARMAEFNRGITNPRINTRVSALTEVAGEILAHVAGHPEKIRSVRQFLNYYLPTTVKLLESYDELSRQSVKGENIGEAMEKIEGIMDTLVKAYEKELDDLFQDKAMDVSAEIAVMQNMIQNEGIYTDFFGKKAN